MHLNVAHSARMGLSEADPAGRARSGTGGVGRAPTSRRAATGDMDNNKERDTESAPGFELDRTSGDNRGADMVQLMTEALIRRYCKASSENL